ncbi:MAG: ABC transporter ATP-binding protein [Planctomycetota bacterium]|jgi:ABC-2 type transport system ATP-binding protein
MEDLLDVSSLSYSYGDQLAVDDVSLSVRKGEVFGLLGPNGAGKTTAISCLCGLLAPRAGTLAFEGRPFAPRERPGDRARLGYVPQDLAVYDDMSARENLEFFARIQGAADVGRAVEQGLSLAGLDGRADERVKRFSGGMKRRLNVAVAMLHDPQLVLLDEPTVGVDPQSRHHIFETIERVASEGRSMLYTSHSMDEVERLCDRVAILDQGKLVALGTAEDLARQAGVEGADLERTFLELTGHSLRDGAA